MRDPLHHELSDRAEDGKRFSTFLAANRDKIRKKLSSAADDAALLDVRAELLMAQLLSSDERFALAFESYGSGKRGPDLTVVFRDNQRFNVEVTRLRPRAADEGAQASRVARVLLAKTRQLAVSMPNVVALIDAPGSLTSDTIAAATRHMKTGADRALLAAYRRLSGVAIVHLEGGELWMNLEARHPLPRAVALALSRGMAGNGVGPTIGPS